MRGATAVLSLGALVVAGCFGANGSDGVEDRAQLADYLGCGIAYPDGTPVDCGQNEARPLDAEVPEGWFCVDEFGFDEAYARIWTDGEGRVALEGFFTRTPKVEADDVIVGRVIVTGGDVTTYLDFGGSQGVAVLPDLIPGEAAELRFYVANFRAANGTPGFLSTQTLEVPATEYDGDPWYLWRFVDGSDTYHFSTMYHLTTDAGARWASAGIAHLSGEDFEVDLWSGLETGLAQFLLYKDPVQRAVYTANPNCR